MKTRVVEVWDLATIKRSFRVDELNKERKWVCVKSFSTMERALQVAYAISIDFKETILKEYGE